MTHVMEKVRETARERSREQERERKLQSATMSNLSRSACSDSHTSHYRTPQASAPRANDSTRKRERDGGQRDKHRRVQLFTVSLMIITMTGSHNNNWGISYDL